MVILAIVICTIGMLLIPLGRLYAIKQARNPKSKFANEEYAQKFRIIILLVSLAICGTALLILYFLEKSLEAA